MSTRRNVQRILFVDADGALDQLPDSILAIREWIWMRTPFVRWSYLTGTDIMKRHLSEAVLGVLLWPADSGAADPIFKRLRQDGIRSLPLLVVTRHPVREEIIRTSMVGRDRWHLLPTCDSPEPAMLTAAFETLGFKLRDYDLRLELNQQDPFATGLIESFGRKHLECISSAQADVRQVGRRYLEHLIQRFFPEDKIVNIHPVGGGWSGDSLCRVHVGPKKQEHFIKFYSDRSKYEAEFKNHLKAQAVLKRHTVTLKRVPNLGKKDEPQGEAFPAETRPPVYPICFESAAEGYPGRKTLKELYTVWTDDFVYRAIAELLAVVPGSFDGKDKKKQAPWGYDEGSRFRLTGDLQRSVLDTISDLSSYGPTFCGEDWPVVRRTVENLVYRPLSELSWLEEPRYVAMGYIHGDTNSRNCFFHPKNPARLKLIDCGDFTERGRLISDLAMIERELKIVLMGTDPMAEGYLDLDPRRLSGAPHSLAWRDAEQASIAKGLAYKKEDVERDLAADPSIRRAYRAIACVRARAKEASGRFDRGGRHYFAALLYWTLDILKEPAVRRTKKLLAIYSAAQILRKDFP